MSGQTKWIAFLRGINLGKRRIKMDRLRTLFEEMGFEDVSTFIASGNVVFQAPDADAPEIVQRIERGLADRLGYEVATAIRSYRDLASVAEFEPDAVAVGDDPNLHVFFLDEPADAAMRERLAGLDTDGDRFTAHGREVYWSVSGRMTDSTVQTKALEKAIGTDRWTSRNVNTVRKMVARFGDA